MKNVLGTMNEIENLIRSGYGYAQLLDKLELTEDDLRAIIAEKPAFALVIKSRYGVIIEPTIQEEQPKPTKSLKRKKKEEESKGDATKEVVSE